MAQDGRAPWLSAFAIFRNHVTSRAFDMEKPDVRRAYDEFARWYDSLETLPELLGISALRRWILRHARGRILEVAVGTGRNLRHYPEGSPIVGVDLSTGMMERAAQKASSLKKAAHFAVMDGERLALPDDAFDTVVSSLTLCTFPDPVRALHEMRRVCRRDGRVLLVEHGRSSVGWLGRWQDRGAERHAQMLGCHWNREPLDIVHAAGLEILETRRRFLGVFHAIAARPD